MNPFAFPTLSRSNAAMALTGGAGLLLFPELLLRVLGVPEAFAGELYGRAYATSLVNIGIISWVTRDCADKGLVRGVTGANAVQDALITATLLHAVLTAQANAWTWVLVLTFAWQVVVNGVAFARAGR